MEYFATKDQYASRINTCKQCRHFEPTTTLCKACNCVIALKGRWAGSSCIHGYWRVVQSNSLIDPKVEE